MDHKACAGSLMKRLASEPVDQFVTVLCCQDLLNGVFGPQGNNLVRRGQQKQVMIAQYDMCGRAEALDVTQDIKGAGASIDKVAGEPKVIPLRVELNGVNESFKGCETTLYVADCVGSHEQAGDGSRRLVIDHELGVACFNLTGQTAACRKGPGYPSPHRSAGGHGILQNSVHRIFIENAEIPVGVDIHLQGF